MKTFFKLMFVLAFFGLLAVASTKKIIPDVCDGPINNYVKSLNTQNYFTYYLGTFRDSLVFKTSRTSGWDGYSAEICRILKDSCKVAGYKIIVVDTSFYSQPQNTPYGHQIYFRDCR